MDDADGAPAFVEQVRMEETEGTRALPSGAATRTTDEGGTEALSGAEVADLQEQLAEERSAVPARTSRQSASFASLLLAPLTPSHSFFLFSLLSRSEDERR